MKKDRAVVFAALLQVAFSVYAQEAVRLSKVEVLERILKNNTTLKIEGENYNQAKADYRQTNAVFLPNIAVSHTGISTTNPLMAFGAKLNQEILTQNDFNPALLNNPEATKNFATTLEVQQPLINADGIYQRKAAKSKMAAMALKTQRTSDYLKLEAKKAYMQLQLAHKAVKVLEQALTTANENLKLAKNSFKQGYLQQADVLNVEVRLTEVQNQLQQAQSQVLNASNYISFLMNDDTFALYQPSDSLVVNVLSVSNKQVSENRSDIKALALANAAYQDMSKADKMAFLPRLNAFGSYQLYDDKVFQGQANGYLVGAQLSWDIFQGYKRFGKMQKSKSELDKSKLEYQQYISKSKLELNQAKRWLSDAENKLELTRLALQQSEESLRIRTNRYKEGLEKTSDLLTAETQYAQKQLEYYQTIFEYNYAQAYMEFLTQE